MANQLFRLNSVAVPDAYKPQHCSGVIHPVGLAYDLAGRPIGGQGKPWVRLSWDVISAAAWDYWATYVGTSALSVVLTDLVVPDFHNAAGTGGYTYHSVYSSAVMERIRPTSEPRVHSTGGQTDLHLLGGAEVIIRELEV